MNNTAVQISEEATGKALHNLKMINALTNYAVDALAGGGANIARIRLREIVAYAQETIEMLTPEQD